MDNTTTAEINKRLLKVCSALLVVLALLMVVFFYVRVSAEQSASESTKILRYRVVMQNEAAGYISSPAVVWDWLERKRSQLQIRFPSVQNVVKIGDIRFEEEWADTWPDDSSMEELLEKKAEVRKRGVQIRIDGKLLGVVRDEAAAQQILEKYKQIKLSGLTAGLEKDSVIRPKDKDKVTILSSDASGNHSNEKLPPVFQSVQFVQKIELLPVDVEPEDIADSQTLLELIETGDVQPLKYTVIPGDCISCIASKHKIDKQVIYANNPTIRNNLIHVGDELDLTVLQPLLALRTVEQRTTEVEIPFQTDYIEDTALKMGITETVTSGQKGLKQVAWNTTRIDGEFVEEEAIAEITLRPSIRAVLKKGTRIVPGIGNGSFAWPVYRAKLTSEYGKRWGEFHPGTDMVSEQSAILAADNGKIVFAGWKNGYGNCIIIDHQNGYKTLYGHLSKIMVSEAEIVQKGDKIGIMGSTGNATGIHLHFEIRIGEQQENPMKYLSKAD